MDERPIREIFPEKLKYYMALNGKTRNDLVHDLGLKYTTIRDWEIGNTVPRMEKVELLANYFRCNNADLLEDKKEPAISDEFSNVKRQLLDLVSELSESEAAVLLASLKSALGKP